MSTPRYVKVIGAICAVGLAVVLYAATQVAGLRASQRENGCRFAAAAREDSRAVWLYLIGREPDRRDDPDVVAFIAFLDERLPSLRCDGSALIPQGD